MSIVRRAASAALVFLAWSLPWHAVHADVISATDVNPDPNVFEAYLTSIEKTVTLDGSSVHAMVYKDDPPAPFVSAGSGIPAPEIKVKVGDTVIVHYRNALPNEGASIHWHGIELDNDSDGTAVTQDAVLPGQSYLYRFKTFRPGLFWYHSHMLPGDATFAGMYGSLVVENLIEGSLKGSTLPTDADTHTVVLSDIEFDGAGKVGKQFDPDGSGSEPASTFTINRLVELCHLGAEGDPSGNKSACSVPNLGATLLVNGQKPGASAPTFSVKSGQPVRLRLINAAIAREYRLKITGSADNKLYRIGGEGGLLDRIVLDGGIKGTWDTKLQLGEVGLGAGDRADVVFVPSGSVGTIVKLEKDSWSGSQFGSGAATMAYFEIVAGAASGSLPQEGDPLVAGTMEDNDNIRAGAVDPLVDPAPNGGTSDETIRITNNPTGMTPPCDACLPSIDNYSAMLDGNVGNGDFLTLANPPNARYARVGDLLELTAVNETGNNHPFHLHGFSMQPVRVVDDVTGDTLYTFDHDEFIDTFEIYRRQRFVFRIRLDDRRKDCDVGGLPGPVTASCSDDDDGGAIGRWVYHCHIFQHAGLGMMSEIVVLEADDDGDGVVNSQDNCPAVANAGQENADGDSAGDACDGCPDDPNKTAPLMCGCGVPDVFDFGDAPPPYPTLLAQNGAQHCATPLKLGSLLDMELDGQPAAGATGDDTNAADDEDGSAFSPLTACLGGTIDVTVAGNSGPARVNAWIDFNRDGDWSDPGERVIAGAVLASGTHQLGFTVPPGAVAGQSYARVRVTQDPVGNDVPTGLSKSGEVEDQTVAIDAVDQILMTPAVADNYVLENQCVQAHAQNAQANPMSGIPLTFVVTGANPSNGAGTTDASGNADFCWTSAQTGHDTLSASFCAKTGESKITWQRRPDVIVASSYVTASLSVGSLLSGKIIVQHRATLTDGLNDLPIVGRLLQFTSTGGAPLCAAVTGIDGGASCNVTITGTLATVVGLGYRVNFAGDAIYVPQSATGKLLLLTVN